MRPFSSKYVKKCASDLRISKKPVPKCLDFMKVRQKWDLINSSFSFLIWNLESNGGLQSTKRVFGHLCSILHCITRFVPYTKQLVMHFQMQTLFVLCKCITIWLWKIKFYSLFFNATLHWSRLLHWSVKVVALTIREFNATLTIKIQHYQLCFHKKMSFLPITIYFLINKGQISSVGKKSWKYRQLCCIDF